MNGHWGICGRFRVRSSCSMDSADNLEIHTWGDLIEIISDRILPYTFVGSFSLNKLQPLSKSLPVSVLFWFSLTSHKDTFWARSWKLDCPGELMGALSHPQQIITSISPSNTRVEKWSNSGKLNIPQVQRNQDGKMAPQIIESINVKPLFGREMFLPGIQSWPGCTGTADTRSHYWHIHFPSDLPASFSSPRAHSQCDKGSKHIHINSDAPGS